MKRIVFPILAALFATGIHLTQAAPPDPQLLDGVAAAVNSDVITFSQVRDLTGPIENSARQQLSGPALAEKIKEVRLNAINMLIDRQLILQEFRKMKGQIPSHAIDERINETIRGQFGGDRSAFLKTLAAQGLTQDKMRKMQEENIIVKYMRGREVKSDVLVSQAEVEKFYAQHRDDWTTNSEIKLRMIKIMPGNEPEKKRTLIGEIRAKVLKGADFADLARIYSEDSTQDQGGDWGWVKQGDMAGEMDRQVFLLKKGKVSEVLSMNGAFYLLLADDRKPGISKPLKEVREEIERRLTQAQRQEQEKEWVNRLRKKAYIKIY